MLLEVAVAFLDLELSWNTREETGGGSTDDAGGHDKDADVLLDGVATRYSGGESQTPLPKSVPATRTGIILHDLARTCVG